MSDNEELLQSVTLEELLKMEFPPPNWVVKDLLSEGLCILSGSPKAGKSWFALDLCVAVAKGGTFLGLPVDAGEAVYIALEDVPRRLKERTLKLLNTENSDDNEG